MTSPTTDQSSQTGTMGREPNTNYHSDPGEEGSEWRRLFAELLGTFLLTFVAAGADVISAATGNSIGHFGKVVAPALLIMALIYTIGDVSGAHLNPAVTVAFTLRRDFPWRRVPGYWLAQLVGATLAAGLLRILYGDVGHLGATLPNPHVGDLPALVMEFALTSMLVLVILGTAHNHRIVGHNAALAVAATIAFTGIFASPVSGASMNPARSFGPDLIGGTLGTMWIYIAGPLAGAVVASFIAWIFEGKTNKYARQAATGS